jgi:thiamine-phosphate pyrophosphorylase
MNQKKGELSLSIKQDFKLYVITGEDYHPGRSLMEVMEASLKGGADMLQLRDKKASKRELMEKAKLLRDLTAKYNVPLIINDHVDIALAVEADGVHLGQDDLPLAVARSVLGSQRIIGISTHSIEQARAAVKGGADYIGVGPIFPTATKPGRTAVTTTYVAQAAAEIRIPIVAIGGITLDNAAEVLRAGARRLCAVSAIVGSSDPEAVSRKLLDEITTWNSKPQELQTSIQDIIVTVNGQQGLTKAATLQALAEQYQLMNKRVIAELDGEMIPRQAWSETLLRSGASVEFVHFVGGG